MQTRAAARWMEMQLVSHVRLSERCRDSQCVMKYSNFLAADGVSASVLMKMCFDSHEMEWVLATVFPRIQDPYGLEFPS
jgi:hypothetical protein